MARIPLESEAEITKPLRPALLPLEGSHSAAARFTATDVTWRGETWDGVHCLCMHFTSAERSEGGPNAIHERSEILIGRNAEGKWLESRRLPF